MSDYYVDANSGSDSTGDGTGWSSAWKTIDHAIGSSPAITLSGTGDTLHVRGGIYYGSVSLGLSPSSGNGLTVVGEDGFVEWAAWSNSTTQVSAAALEASGKSFVTIKNVRMIGGIGSGASGSCLNVSGTWSDWTIEDCEFIGGVNASRPKAISFASTSASAINVAFRRCDVLAVGQANTYVCLHFQTYLAAAQYGLNAIVENCRFIGGSTGLSVVQAGGTGSFWSTGLAAQQCTFISCYRGVNVTSTTALTTPLGVYGCDFLNCNYGVIASSTDQVNEDGNYFWCVTNRQNVNAGTHSDTTSMPRFNIAIERLAGGNPRPFAEPLEGSALIGAGGYGTPPSVDLYGQTRPGSPSIGALERDAFETPSNTYIFSGEY